MAKQIKRKKKSRLAAEIRELLKETDPEALLKELTATVVNEALQAELTEHLDYENGEEPPEGQSNRRNGVRKKRVRTQRGEVEIAVPRDREGTFEPQLIERYQRAIPGFDDKLLALYARGMSTRDIRAFFEEEYGVHVSPSLISRVTDAVSSEVEEWRNRPLQSRYAFVYVDALVVKVRDDGVVKKSLYMAIGVDADGQRDVLGLWLQPTEGASTWLAILEELKHRGVEDILILCADGLTGLCEAVEAVFPKVVFQTCIVHLIRNTTRVVAWRDRKELCKDLRPIYTAPSLRAAKAKLKDFEAKWGESYPMIGEAWRRRMDEWSPFLDYPAEVRRAIYTTNIIEATNRQVRKVLKTKGALPHDDAVYKLVFLVLRSQAKKWHENRRQQNWAKVRVQLNILFKDRFPLEL